MFVYICDMEKKETVKYVLRIDPKLKKSLENEASEQGRSLNGHINHLLKNRDQEDVIPNKRIIEKILGAYKTGK